MKSNQLIPFCSISLALLALTGCDSIPERPSAPGSNEDTFAVDVGMVAVKEPIQVHAGHSDRFQFIQSPQRLPGDERCPDLNGTYLSKGTVHTVVTLKNGRLVEDTRKDFSDTIPWSRSLDDELSDQGILEPLPGQGPPRRDVFWLVLDAKELQFRYWHLQPPPDVRLDGKIAYGRYDAVYPGLKGFPGYTCRNGYVYFVDDYINTYFTQEPLVSIKMALSNDGNLLYFTRYEYLALGWVVRTYVREVMTEYLRADVQEPY